MKLDTLDAESPNAWWRIRRRLECVRDWPENGDGPYSFLFCLSLLLALGLIVKIGH
jgi:hypothetical protein